MVDVNRANTKKFIRELDGIKGEKTKITKTMTDEQLIEIFGDLSDEVTNDSEDTSMVSEELVEYFNAAFSEEQDSGQDEPDEVEEEEEEEPEEEEEAEEEPEEEEEVEEEPEEEEEVEEEPEEEEEEPEEEEEEPEEEEEEPEEDEEEEEEEEPEEDEEPEEKPQKSTKGKKTVKKSTAKAAPKKTAAKKTTKKPPAKKAAAKTTTKKTTTAKKPPAKTAAKKTTTAKKTTATKKAPTRKLDCFGFVVGGNTSKFAIAVAKKPQDMKSIAAKGLGSHPKAFKKMSEAKIMTRNNEGVMSLTAKGKKLYEKFTAKK